MVSVPLECTTEHSGHSTLGMCKGTKGIWDPCHAQGNIEDSVPLACVRANRGLGTLELHKGKEWTLYPWHV